jgi:hypothetical protein
MAKADPVSEVFDSLSYEQQIEQVPELPARPFLLAEDYPTGDGLAQRTQAVWELQQYERERDARQFLSGYNASPYANCGPESPQRAQARLDEDAEYREQRYGLPDSPEDMPAQARPGERKVPY